MHTDAVANVFMTLPAMKTKGGQMEIIKLKTGKCCCCCLLLLFAAVVVVAGTARCAYKTVRHVAKKQRNKTQAKNKDNNSKSNKKARARRAKLSPNEHKTQQ